MRKRLRKKLAKKRWADLKFVPLRYGEPPWNLIIEHLRERILRDCGVSRKHLEAIHGKLDHAAKKIDPA